MQYCSSSEACVSKIAQTPSLREQIVRCKSLDLGGDSSLVLVPTWSPMSLVSGALLLQRCDGDGGIGTAAAAPLTSVGQKYTDPQLMALFHNPNSKMTLGGMTSLDLKPDDLEALVAYLRQLR